MFRGLWWVRFLPRPHRCSTRQSSYFVFLPPLSCQLSCLSLLNGTLLSFFIALPPSQHHPGPPSTTLALPAQPRPFQHHPSPPSTTPALPAPPQHQVQPWFISSGSLYSLSRPSSSFPYNINHLQCLPTGCLLTSFPLLW